MAGGVAAATRNERVIRFSAHCLQKWLNTVGVTSKHLRATCSRKSCFIFFPSTASDETLFAEEKNGTFTKQMSKPLCGIKTNRQSSRESWNAVDVCNNSPVSRARCQWLTSAANRWVLMMFEKTHIIYSKSDLWDFCALKYCCSWKQYPRSNVPQCTQLSLHMASQDSHLVIWRWPMNNCLLVSSMRRFQWLFRFQWLAEVVFTWTVWQISKRKHMFQQMNNYFSIITAVIWLFNPKLSNILKRTFKNDPLIFPAQLPYKYPIISLCDLWRVKSDCYEIKYTHL